MANDIIIIDYKIVKFSPLVKTQNVYIKEIVILRPEVMTSYKMTSYN